MWKTDNGKGNMEVGKQKSARDKQKFTNKAFRVSMELQEKLRYNKTE
jgi:hypothetical protein